MTGIARSSMSSNNQTSLPTSGDSLYSYSITRSQQHQDLTPYSAVRFSGNHSISLCDFFSVESDKAIQVSSFNLPAQPDTNLYTPISMTNSPVIPIKTTTTMDNDIQAKLSPLSMSPTPTYEMFGNVDDDDFGPRFNSSPMKPKIAYPSLLSTTCGSLGPDSPTFCASPPVPYFGSYGVSAPAKSSRTPPSTHHSPRMQVARPSNSSTMQHYQSSSTHNSYRPTPQAPVLIAPSPHGLRPAMASYRQNSLPSNQSSPPQSQRHAVYSHEDDKTNSPGTKRSQKKTEPSYNDYYLIVSTAELRAELNDQELLILDLRYKEGLQWKEVAKVYSQKHNKKTAVAALQMRRRRLMERLSVSIHEEIVYILCYFCSRYGVSC